ncbi:MAG: DNA-processing protein DprA [Candidatus Avilachnospira sp.]
MDKAEKLAQYFFHSIKGMTSKKMFSIREKMGSFRNALDADERELFERRAIKNEKDALRIGEALRHREERIERFERLEAEGIRYVSYFEDEFPERLKNIPQSPAGIFVKGKLPEAHIPSAAIIGARACSEYGKDVALMFGEELAKAGVQIISGLASGIDSHAQRGAVKAGKATFSVLGCGVNICYPKENYYLYRRITDLGGGIISEYPPDTEPLAVNFPQRNRLISGLGDCLIVLEARQRSGTSITVDFALDQGKEVFALPGRISDPLGKGCNELIKNGAAVLTEPEDVLSYLNIRSPGKADKLKNREATLAKTEKTVYAVLDSEEKYVEDIAALSGLSVAETLEKLTELELKGLARETTGFYYMKLG